MAVEVSEVRSETQIPSSIISDADIEYVIDRVGADDLYAVCSYTLRLVLRKYRGRYRIRIGSVWESIDPKELRSLIREFDTKAGFTFSDGEEMPDSFFTRSGI